LRDFNEKRAEQYIVSFFDFVLMKK